MQKKMPTLIFDLGGVYFTDGTDNAINTICKKYILDRQIVVDIFYGEAGMMYRENKITINEFWNIAKNNWKIENESTDELAQIWHKGYVPIDGVKNIIIKLRENDFEILYLSGSTDDRVKYLENKYNFLQYFNDGVFTFTVGVRKPSPEPYQHLLKKSSNTPENCIYIDNQEKYLIPAKELGIKTILFTTSANLYKDLESIGII